MSAKENYSFEEVGNSGLVPLAATGFLVLACAFGFYFDEIPDKLKKPIVMDVDKEKLLIFSAVAIPSAFYKFIDGRIADKSRSLSEKYREKFELKEFELKKELSTEQNQVVNSLKSRFSEQFKERLQQLEKEIKLLVLSTDQHNTIQAKLSDARRRLQYFGDWLTPAQEIVEWLDSSDNDYENANNLVSSTVTETARAMELSQDCIAELENNLIQCFDWIRQSIEYVNPCVINSEDEEKYLSAIQKTHKGFEIYQVALGTFESKLLQNAEACNTAQKREIVSEMISCLYTELEEISQKHRAIIKFPPMV